MYGCESWTIKKAEHQRIDACELWCWRRFLRVPWATRRSNQSILKEINPELEFIGRTDAEVETLILWPVHWKRPLWWTRLTARGDGVTEDEMVGWHHWFTGHEFEQTQGDSEGQGSLTYWSSWDHRQLDTTWPVKYNNKDYSKFFKNIKSFILENMITKKYIYHCHFIHEL